MPSILVAAIDFGTTFSGSAYSFLHEHKKDPLKIHVSTWTSGNRDLTHFKTSTCVLFDPTQTFHLFGYEAEEKYSDLALDDKHHDWYFFRRFKMIMSNKMGLTREALLEDDKGKKMEAMKVFSSMICYLKDHMLTEFKTQLRDILHSDITWVLIVPAFWNDSSKQFMREAAEKTGISGDRILLVPEPEAGWVYCMNENKYMHRKNCSSIGFKAGTKCMVIIAESDRVEITVYDVQHKGMLKKLFSSAGNCDWGGNKVDDALCSLLTDIFGDAVMKLIISQYEEDFSQFLSDLEHKKWTIRPSEEEKITFTLPPCFLDTYLEINPECELKTRISSLPKYNNKLLVVGSKIRIDSRIAKAFFDESCSKIIFHMQELFLYPTLKDVSSIILVGSYAKSPMLEFAIREAFQDPHREVFVPEDAVSAVLKGAVIYGHQLQQNLPI